MSGSLRLQELHVRDLALIEDVWLELGEGMTVLTGETGAGKTVLVGALKLLIGERADATAVRAGSSEALVEGRFADGEAEVVARRRVASDGRSRCYLDGEMATVGALGETLGSLVDLHGQHDHQLLLRPVAHVGLFDRVADPMGEARDAYREALAAARDADRALDALRAALDDRERSVAEAAAIVAEIDAVAPLPGEDAAIAEALPRLRHAERLSDASAAAWSAIAGETGARDAVAVAVAALGRAQGIDAALDRIAETLGDAEAVLADASGALRDYGDAIEHDPRALDAMEARAASIAALVRRHGPTLDDVIASRDAAASALETLGDADDALARAAAACAESRRRLEDAAAGLRATRDAAAGPFLEALSVSARELAMPTARFELARTPLDPAQWTEDGPERVEFLYAPTEGEPARPLARIGSGGEISRVMLALKGVLGEADPVPILVFDEIDAGIGGATATAVGARLRALAAGRQVLVVTHLAQVAAFADAQLLVAKSEADGRARTEVRPVTGEDRVDEIARMLSGGVTEASRSHARELLEAAGSGSVC